MNIKEMISNMEREEEEEEQMRKRGGMKDRVREART